MKLFLIIYVSGNIGGSVGPLPYELDVCVMHRDAMRANQSAIIASGGHKATGEKVSDDDMAILMSLSFECEYRSDRPDIEADIGEVVRP